MALWCPDCPRRSRPARLLCRPGQQTAMQPYTEEGAPHAGAGVAHAGGPQLWGSGRCMTNDLHGLLRWGRPRSWRRGWNRRLRQGPSDGSPLRCAWSRVWCTSLPWGRCQLEGPLRSGEVRADGGQPSTPPQAAAARGLTRLSGASVSWPPCTRPWAGRGQGTARWSRLWARRVGVAPGVRGSPLASHAGLALESASVSGKATPYFPVIDLPSAMPRSRTPTPRTRRARSWGGDAGRGPPGHFRRCWRWTPCRRTVRSASLSPAAAPAHARAFKRLPR